MAGESIIVVEDDPALRDALEALLTTAGFFVNVFDSGEALTAARATLDQIDCALVDLRLPGMDGLAVHRWLTSEFPGVPVVIVTAHGDVRMAVTAIKAGVADFVEKPFEPKVLLNCLREALTRDPNQRRKHHGTEIVRARRERLTVREREVMDLVIGGHSNKTIGIRLAISHRTVENHRARVMEKMEARHLSELIHMALIE